MIERVGQTIEMKRIGVAEEEAAAVSIEKGTIITVASITRKGETIGTRIRRVHTRGDRRRIEIALRRGEKHHQS